MLPRLPRDGPPRSTRWRASAPRSGFPSPWGGASGASTMHGACSRLVRVVAGAVHVPVVASGGIGERAHVVEAFRAGADAVLAASVFHDGDDTVAGIKEDLALNGIRVRP